MSTNCDIIVFFPIYGQFAAIRKLDSGRMVNKTYIFINNNFLSYMCVYLPTKFHVSSIFLTSFNQGVILHNPHRKTNPWKAHPNSGYK